MHREGNDTRIAFHSEELLLLDREENSQNKIETTPKHRQASLRAGFRIHSFINECCVEKSAFRKLSSFQVEGNGPVQINIHIFELYTLNNDTGWTGSPGHILKFINKSTNLHKQVRFTLKYLS